MQFPSGRGHHHENFVDAGDLGGNGIHQHRRGIAGLAPRHIDPHPRQGRDPLSQAVAQGVQVVPGGLLLAAVKVAAAAALDPPTVRSANRIEYSLSLSVSVPLQSLPSYPQTKTKILLVPSKIEFSIGKNRS